MAEKEVLTEAERRMIGFLVRNGKAVSRYALSPANVRTCLRLSRRGLVEGTGLFRLSWDGAQQAEFHGIRAAYTKGNCP